MKQSFRSLTGKGAIVAAVVGLAVVGLAVCGLEARGQESARRSQESGGRSQEGQGIVDDAARRLLAEPAIAADLRYRVDAFGHVLVGSGSYAQLAAGSQRLVRLDLRMQIGGQQATIQEIRGTDAYWIRRHVPPALPTLGRVDLRQLRRSLAQATAPGAQEVLPQGDWIMHGGLSRLLTALAHNFQFDPPRTDELQFSAADGQSLVRLPIWNVNGVWKPNRLAALAGKDAERRENLPEQLPDRVELVLGRTEDILPLFPYRITYWQTGGQHKQEGPSEPHELLTLELYNVARRASDPREFDYQPGDQEVENLTQSYVQRLTPGNKLR